MRYVLNFLEIDLPSSSSSSSSQHKQEFPLGILEHPQEPVRTRNVANPLTKQANGSN